MLSFAIARRFGILGDRRRWLSEAAMNPLIASSPVDRIRIAITIWSPQISVLRRRSLAGLSLPAKVGLISSPRTSRSIRDECVGPQR